jgi:O-antigen ligase
VAGWLKTERLRGLLVVAVAAVLAYEVGVSAATDQRLAKLIAIAPLLVLLLVLEPEKLFIGWLAAAPLVQGAASGDHHGHVFFKYLFLVPPLIMLARMAMGAVRVRGFWLVDALPGLYLGYILVSVRLFPSVYASPQHSTVKAIYQTIGIGIIAYYVAAFAKTSRRFPELVAGAFLWSGLVVAVLGVVNGVAHWTLWHNRVLDTTTGSYSVVLLSRAVATFQSPEELGIWVGAALAIAVAVLVWNGPRALKRPAIPLVFVSGPALYLTYTRAPALGAAVVVAAMLLLARRTRWATALAVGAAAVILFASWGAISSTSIYRNRLGVTQTATPRVALTHVALRLWREKPLFGQGYATFDQVKFTLPLPLNELHFVTTLTSHDTYLTVLAETGLVGLFLLLVPWFVIGWRALSAGARGLVEPWIIASCLGATASYAIAAFATDARFFPLMWAIPWIALGLVRKVMADAGAGARPAR